MSLQVEQDFIGKYKKQFYSGQISIEQLVKEKKQLYKILDELHQKTQMQFEKVCQNAQRKNYSHRNSLRKNSENLPSLVINAQIKNTQTYRQVLENDRKKLQKKMTASLVLKQKNVNEQIQEQKQKLIQQDKKNKLQKLQIKKMGSKLVEQKNSIKQALDSLIVQLKLKKMQVESKKKKISLNNQKSQSLRQKIEALQQKSRQKVGQNGEESAAYQQECKQNEKIINQYKALQMNRNRINQNNQSLITRLNQEYYLKLKQLDLMVNKNQNIQNEIMSLQRKIQQKNSHLSNYLYIA